MHLPDIGLEAIDFQKNHLLPKVVEEELTKLRALNPVEWKNIRRHSVHAALSKATGMDITLKLYPDAGASVYVPDIDINCPVINEWRRYFQNGEHTDKLFKKSDFIDGTVDIRRVRVSGDYSKIPVTINLGTELLAEDSGYTIRQVTAIVLHEIGHAFYYLYALGDLSTTNYILQDAARRMAGVREESVRMLIVNETEQNTGVPVSEIEELKHATNPEQCSVLLLKAHAEAVRSDLGEDIYSMRGFEKLADNFASRMGYGVEVVTGLDKLLRFYGSDAYWSKTRFHLTQVGIFVGITLMVAAVPPIIFFPIIALMVNGLEEEYDYDARRFKAIANDIRALLKDRTLDPDAIAKALADLKTIESITDKMEIHTGYIVRIQKLLRPAIRRQANNMELQLLMEDLSNNRLYEAAALLRQQGQVS